MIEQTPNDQNFPKKLLKQRDEHNFLAYALVKQVHYMDDICDDALTVGFFQWGFIRIYIGIL